MARKRRPNEKSTYRTAPQVPSDLAERYRIVALVVAEQMTVSDGARQLGIARANFQSLVNKTKAAMVESLTPRPGGPTPKPTEQVAMAREVENLRRDNERLNHQLHTMDKLLGTAGEVIRDLRRPERPRSKTSSPRRVATSGTADDEDPHARSRRTAGSISPISTVTTMREPGATWCRRAAAVGVGASTLRRYARKGRPQRRPSRARPVSPENATAARTLVRELRGLAGAASLAQSVGISRRQAAALKAAELAEMERDRKAAAARVEVLAAGILRGFDALELTTTAGRRYLLAAGDGRVPYRTSITAVPRYDATSVAAALDADFAEHGPPLVLRLDRASCHRAPAVASVLRRWRVLPLHGPPRCSRYYGQLERQNREHRAWLDGHALYNPDELVADTAHMRTVLNRLWRRPTLDWRTAECVWRARGAVEVDRDELAADVTDGTRRRLAAGVSEQLAPRLAVEHALTQRGLLRITPKPKVLCAH